LRTAIFRKGECYSPLQNRFVRVNKSGAPINRQRIVWVERNVRPLVTIYGADNVLLRV
jgi:hypothetical protein